MTTLGKVLVFVNLLFSLITGALIVMVFITRTNWKFGYDDLTRQLTGERSKLIATIKDKADMQKQYEDQVARIGTDLKLTTQQLDQVSKENAVAKENLDKATKRADDATQTAKSMQSTMEAMKTEVNSLDKRLQEREQLVLTLEKQVQTSKATEVKAVIDFQAAKERNEQLLDLLQQRDKEIARLQGISSERTGQAQRNPPPEDVKGRVMVVDEGSGLVTINLGSDSGVNKGNTLEVFRLAPRPTYLGTMRILDARPHEAVGKLIGAQARGKIQAGDEVASEILGKR